MTDINDRPIDEPAKTRKVQKNPGAWQADAERPELSSELMEFAELLFFAYRDFISDSDVILDELGFGRAHHRVLHFVNRYPGLRVAALLNILKITKQSLARVLKQLIDEDYIEQYEGHRDRRVRLLYPTKKGSILARRLAEPQMRRISRALKTAGSSTDNVLRQYFLAMIKDTERPHVVRLIERGHKDAEAGGAGMKQAAKAVSRKRRALQPVSSSPRKPDTELK